MPVLQSAVKTNVMFGLSSALLAIYVYKNYDDLPSINDIKLKFSNYGKETITNNADISNNDLMKPDSDN